MDDLEVLKGEVASLRNELRRSLAVIEKMEKQLASTSSVLARCSVASIAIGYLASHLAGQSTAIIGSAGLHDERLRALSQQTKDQVEQLLKAVQEAAGGR